MLLSEALGSSLEEVIYFWIERILSFKWRNSLPTTPGFTTGPQECYGPKVQTEGCKRALTTQQTRSTFQIFGFEVWLCVCVAGRMIERMIQPRSLTRNLHAKVFPTVTRNLNHFRRMVEPFKRFSSKVSSDYEPRVVPLHSSCLRGRGGSSRKMSRFMDTRAFPLRSSTNSKMDGSSLDWTTQNGGFLLASLYNHPEQAIPMLLFVQLSCSVAPFLPFSVFFWWLPH